MGKSVHRMHHYVATIIRYPPLLVSVGIGFAFRLWSSITQPVFSDEAFSLYEVKFWHFPYDPSYPPGYPLFLKAWVTISDMLVWIRLPSVIAGTLTLVVFWRMLRTHISIRAANVGVFFLALSAIHVHYSWIARPNSIAAFIELLSLSQLLGISRIISQKKLPHIFSLVLYFITNAVGAFVCHGYSFFLAASLVSILVWAIKHDMLSVMMKQFRLGTVVLLLHTVLPILQYFAVAGHIVPLVDSAEWIPDLSIYALTSTFLALTNGAKTLTSEMWTAAPITIYLTLCILCIVGQSFYRLFVKKAPFVAIFSVLFLATTLSGVAFLAVAFDMNTLQPRLFLLFNMLYCLGLGLYIPDGIDTLRKKRFMTKADLYTSIFIGMLILFGVRSLIILNVLPYYSDPADIAAVRALKKKSGSTVLVFPQYQVLTVKYIWGLDTPYPTSLATIDTLAAFPRTASAERIMAAIPPHTPLTLLLWPPDGALSQGARTVVDAIAPRCTRKEYRTIAILDCPPLSTQE